MTKLGRHESNLEFCHQLQGHVQWAAIALCNECEKLNLLFRISEAYRTQERQNYLYQLGRTIPGQIVTWTLTSDHTQRLAIDLYPINCTHKQIEQVAKRYGITHPWPVNDPPHYSFSLVRPPIIIVIIDPKAEIRRLERAIARTKNDRTRRQRQGRLDRLRRRIAE